ncbi:hypothetical protein LWC05_04295 [Acetobacter sicerae]|uniref:Uncharacterized protein n=1 Tax=Acetobacter sicerae TaxID=85325 RepID=A0ABS8VSM0_9PROT|nr:hypothetical protein [Acetobacter sicerae]MCE0743111.1 hypothetical protein [Acetobacter sicerae]
MALLHALGLIHQGYWAYPGYFPAKRYPIERLNSFRRISEIEVTAVRLCRA